MGCASSSDQPSKERDKATAAAQPTPESDLAPVARPLRDIRRDVIEKDPNALSQAPMPDAHVGLIDEGKTREIDHWLDSMGLEAPAGAADPDFDINRDDKTPNLSAAVLRRHETSLSIEASLSAGKCNHPANNIADPIDGPDLQSEDGDALKDLADQEQHQAGDHHGNPLSLPQPLHDASGSGHPHGGGDVLASSSGGPGGRSALLPVGPNAGDE